MRVVPILMAVFFIVPLVEIYLLIQVGGEIGALPTVFMVVFTAVLGALLLRQQGFTTLRRVQEAMARGQVPALEMVEAVLITLGGGLLLIPGFFTDLLGFICLIPPVRRWLIRRWLQRFFRAPTRQSPPNDPQHPEPDKGPVTIDGEYRREDD